MRKENKRKQLSIKVLQFLILGEKYILVLIYPWDNFPLGQFALGPFVQGAIMWAANHSKGNFP